MTFQSTPPARGATFDSSSDNAQFQFQSTPPARGATTLIHSISSFWGFQSTPPARGATIPSKCHCQIYIISIHAPREGGDGHVGVVGLETDDFNPRPPRGGRPHDISPFLSKKHISIHAPREGGDLGKWLPTTPSYISIHAPREGGDAIFRRPPAQSAISIHAPREGGDERRPVCDQLLGAFQSTPPARGATYFVILHNCHIVYFNPRPPRGGRHGTTDAAT